MRAIFLLVLILFSTLDIYPQVNDSQVDNNIFTNKDSIWKTEGTINLNLGQTTFTNWVAGGENQLSWNGIFKYNINYKHGKNTWENHFDLEYGSIIYREQSSKKVNDKIYLTSKLGYDFNKSWRYIYYLSLQSQFANGYNYPNDSVPISSFMAPGYFMLGFGFDYKPKKWFTAVLTPFSYKLTIVNDANLASSGAFGVEKPVYNDEGILISPAKRFRSEPGAFFKLICEFEPIKDLKTQARLEFFSSFKYKPQNIDINGNLFISYKIAPKFASTLSIDILYDNESIVKIDKDGDGIFEINGPRLQVKEVVGLGFLIRI